MRIKKTPIHILFLTAVCLFASCGGNTEGWKGTVLMEEGVEIIHNPGEPLIEGEVFTLEEDLHIKGGDESRPEEMFLDITGLAVDAENRILVLDPKAGDIKYFDINGGFIKTIGGKGGGPGEFSRPESLACSPAGDIVVYDGGRRIIHVFDDDGVPLREIPVSQLMFFGPEFLSGGGMVGGYADMGEETRIKLCRLDEGGKTLREYVDLFAFRMPKISLFVYNFGPNLIWHALPGDRLVYGDYMDMDYGLVVLDSEGRTVRRITKSYDRVPLPAREAKALILEWFGREIQTPTFEVTEPDFYPPFQTFLVDETGRIYVKRFEALAHKDRHLIEVFGADGKYLGDVTVPAAVVPAVIRGDRVYAIAEDEDGYKTVKRFRMTWNL